MVLLRRRGNDKLSPRRLVLAEGTETEQTFPFWERIEIGRRGGGLPEAEGILLIDDPTVSARHCVITRHGDGRLFLRDTSRNGTRLDGRRLLPNREVEIHPGQALTVGLETTFRLFEDEGRSAPRPASRPVLPTRVAPDLETISVVVGDLAAYTSLIETVSGADLQDALARVFGLLERNVLALGGQVKEYQGDSILAFWEPSGGQSPATHACRAVLVLQRVVEEVSQDRGIWPFAEHPLRMDWAVATGPVSVQVFGQEGPEELSMVGEPIVLAYRLEKAILEPGWPLVCEATRHAAGSDFVFREAGTLRLPGFLHPVHAYFLVHAGPASSEETRGLR
jgi:class 3 adenylate cyclase